MDRLGAEEASDLVDALDRPKALDVTLFKNLPVLVVSNELRDALRGSEGVKEAMQEVLEELFYYEVVEADLGEGAGMIYKVKGSSAASPVAAAEILSGDEKSEQQEVAGVPVAPGAGGEKLPEVVGELQPEPSSMEGSSSGGSGGGGDGSSGGRGLVLPGVDAPARPSPAGDKFGGLARHSISEMH